MDFLHENAKIGSLVVKAPQCARLFEKLGLDYCCKGNKTLQELCDEKNLPVADVLNKLREIPASHDAVNWTQMSVQEIVAHIVETHHSFAREELARISHMLNKVKIKHGHRYAHIEELQAVFESFKESLTKHMKEEENTVFPTLINFDKSPSKDPQQVRDYLKTLDADHLEAGNALEKMSLLTNGYTPPRDACTTHIVMLHSLARLEKNMHEHVHKENHILFPRVMQR